MAEVRLSDIYDLISSLIRREDHSYTAHMQNNPRDAQRARDHLLIQSAFCEVLCALQAVSKKEEEVQC